MLESRGKALEQYLVKLVGDHPEKKYLNDLVNLPDEIAGTLMVFRPFERVSYALVMKATQALHVLDKVTTP